MSTTLETAILAEIPGATRVYIEGNYAYVDGLDPGGAITRYRLSQEALRLALLEREGRPLDIRLGEVDLLAPEADK